MIIPDDRIHDAVCLYLNGAERHKGLHDGWTELQAAAAILSILPYESDLRKSLEEKYNKTHNVLRDEERKEYERGHDLDKPKKSHGKGNRSAIRQMLNNLVSK